MRPFENYGGPLWPIMRSDMYSPQYQVCPNAEAVDDPQHRPSHGQQDGSFRPVSQPVTRLSLYCTCGTWVTRDNAKLMDAF